VLFSTSIAENIAYARPDASDHDIIAAAMAANAHEFIVSLSQGYKTQVGERMRLSGGERQRISARAFLKDAPILILDEPNSSVDTRTEAAIMEAMERLARSHHLYDRSSPQHVGELQHAAGDRKRKTRYCDIGRRQLSGTARAQRTQQCPFMGIKPMPNTAL